MFMQCRKKRLTGCRTVFYILLVHANNIGLMELRTLGFTAIKQNVKGITGGR